MQKQLDGKQCQKTYIKAIQQYAERHNHNFGQNGAKDLQILSRYSPTDMVQIFKSSAERGLSETQTKQNAERYGLNEYKKRKKKSLFLIFKEAICDEMLVVLMVAAVVSILVEYMSAHKDNGLFWVDGVSILVAVIICTSVSTFSNYEKQKQFDELDQMTENTYNIEVIREGRRQQIHRSKIVAGDIIHISNGMQVPADCLLLQGINVHVDESAITGQSYQLEKCIYDICMQMRMDPKGPTPFMISGSNVVTGEGVMMAIVVGKDSQAGKNYELIFSSDEEEEEKTPLQLQLQKLASQIGNFGLASAILIFLVLFVRLIIQQWGNNGFDIKENLQQIVTYLIISITVIVVAIPEGLPLAVTLTLAYSMQAMHRDKILVRKLASCETMGAAKFICSDKTGTITQNKMNVTQIVNSKAMPVQQFMASKVHKSYLQKLSAAIFHNTSAIVSPQKGSQTQIALLKLIRKLTNKNEVDVRKQVGLDGYFKRLPFDSSRKRMTTGMRVGNQNLIFMSGASQQILQACELLHDCQSNQVVKMNKQIRQGLHYQLQSMASRGLRTISVAYHVIDDLTELKSIKLNRNKQVLQQVEKHGFILLGIFGIEDLTREQSRQAIEDCKKAGIKVLMVTGDNKITATKIAQQVGIIEDKIQQGSVIQANELMKKLQKIGLLRHDNLRQKQIGDKFLEADSEVNHKLIEKNNHQSRKIVLQTKQDEETFEAIVNNLSVMARSKPQHKYILVDGINKLGHIVGVTGDGSNDAPALMRGDIGMAMGITGTQVSKNASDIILLDDNFSSIVRAVVWGRNVYLSIRKFLQFQLTVNVIAVCITLISAAVIRQSVFTAVQMLWVNLIMDSLAALALATEPPNREQLLNQQPNTPHEALITKTMIKHILGQATFQLVVLLVLLFEGPAFIPQYVDGFDSVIGNNLQAKYYKGIVEGTIADGKLYTISGQDNYIKWFDEYDVNSRHFTFIYNTFVFLQVFNFICCRRIKDELNFFKDIQKSSLFWIILTSIVVLQVIVVTWGGKFFQVYSYHGLAIVQWLISVAIGSCTMPVSILLRLLPIAKPQQHQYIRKSRIAFNKRVGDYEEIK